MDEIVTTRGERFVVPVRAGAASRSRGLVHDWSKSGATAYLEPIETVEDNNRLAYLKNREKEEIARILASLSSQCRDQAEALAKSAAALTLLDLYLAQGRLARAWRATTPLYQPGDGFELKALRHPLLEKRLSQSGRAIVPLDLMADPHEPVLVISGLNAGGKTVALKTLGLTLALAATGLPIPAAWGSRLDFPVEVIAVMGDNQDLTADLSTFSGHVKAINATLKEAREGVVILLDELGGGTDPAEGAALGLAVLEQIRHSGAICLAATHYHLIKSWAALTPGVVSVAVRSSPLGQPVYGLSYGSPGFSGGLAMARRLGLPEELVAKAESYLDEGQKEALALLKRLEDERAALHKEREDLSLARQKLTQTEAATRASLQKQTEAFKRQSQELDREVKAALGRHRREMGELKKTLLASLEAGQTPDPVALNVKAATLAKELAAKRPKEALSPVTPPLTTVNVGQRVLVGKLSRVGVVKAYNPEKDEALVETGGLTVKAALAELFTAQSEDETPKNRVTLTVSRDDRDGLALNLLGQTVAEATSLVDREIDRALLRGQKRLTIIHGQGTGRLRKGLAAYLKTHPKVAELIWPGEGPGGHGVTTVELA
jgi:DNA mismatch repair protein MutS2